jgi:hypothetical protein
MKAGRAFAYGAKDPNIKIQLLLGGVKRVNEALRQALELQAVRYPQDPTRITPTRTGETDRPPPDEQMHNNQGAGAVENKAILRVIAPTEKSRE